ncbi:hypothetical protein [Epilithonimonas zeae]|uniref:hypothetical protein n=1 Tax=Epilithonimonas zeae TaxID=1416779 RepID=UPI00200E4EC8|nr:hypothetical protein [Epilithonimonas zeae]UQB67595.1 hypothetical protein KI430_11150 [Epilithonimonas zeae]
MEVPATMESKRRHFILHTDVQKIVEKNTTLKLFTKSYTEFFPKLNLQRAF